MQTFLPYADFVTSAQVLDYRRLGKQRVETLQILNTLLGLSQGWQNHPAVKMWRGHETLLINYGIAMCDEWIARGYKDTCRQKIADLQSLTGEREREAIPGESSPSWFGDEQFHVSHQSNLIRKDPIYYSPIFEGVPNDLPYVWPDGPAAGVAGNPL